MARITVEDCLVNEPNRFSLVRLASRRAKQLLSGSQPVTNTRGNRAIVSALREIADGKVRFRKKETFNDNLSEESEGADIEELVETVEEVTAVVASPEN